MQMQKQEDPKRRRPVKEGMGSREPINLGKEVGLSFLRKMGKRNGRGNERTKANN